MKKLGLILSGALLIALFLVWMAVKGTEPVQAILQWHRGPDPAGSNTENMY